ncbi:MAG: SDR family oxidoreductase [Candidatus Dormibacteraeota bacterium]|uniref:SDR family oxidoreductase n=1 Tax=Candidatus Dormiibacter inghamiae TaxID=3127013 RepID=A0A934KHQ3_9BACT|nr:SDR family oxidoreductase [Candidatus Dormibacteraeota bacterium]MBJ7606695.1 SDR family oxidoreductase [Candidatus Dormibacteraeota bacterium]
MTGLEGKVAIVTGAGRGIGKGIARRLAREGCRLVLTALEQNEVEAVADELRQGGAQVVAVAGDIGLPETADRLLETALNSYGTLDILVNNAGWATPVCYFLDLDEEHWDKVIRTNLKSVYLTTLRAARHMARTGVRGSIVNMSSWGGTRSHRQMAAYDASKGGIEAFTRTTALDLGPLGIRVNAVAPSIVQTESYSPKGDLSPLGRAGQPADIAAAVAFLASDDASYITGQVIQVDGGMGAQGRPPALDHQPPERSQPG